MVLPQSPHTHPAAPLVFRLSALSAYSTWGELLAGIRRHNNLTQHKIAKASEAYFIKAGVPMLKPRIYGDMERGRRAPYFRELEPLFRTFVEVYGVEFSDLEITAYIHLAKERMAQKSKRIDRVDEEQWETLTETLFRVNNSKRSQKIHLVRDELVPARHPITEDPESRRLKAVEQALRTDTSHLLEREEWVTKMLTYPETTPQRKLVVVQGHMGTGKSHALALLVQRLAAQSQYYLIPYLLEAGSSKTPEDHLEVFLATIIPDLMQTTPSDEIKQRPLEERIDQVLAALKERSEQGQKVILLLDDAQVIFPSVMEWSPAWAQFLESIVREPHTTTLYMMTRTWPGWEDRRFAYIEETELPELSVASSVAMWRCSGFDDVPEDLLREVSHRCGYNPQLIEMLIAQCKKRSFTFAWSKEGSVASREKKSPNTQRLEDLLAQDTIFDPRMDVKARAVLQHSLTSRLSHQAVQMLACLALSPLGLPFTLLVEEFARAEEAFNELASASAVDLNAAASQRAAIVPLVREAQWQSLASDGRKEGIEARVTDLYDYWLTTLQDFRDDAEKAALISEMVVRYIRMGQLLKAAELFISFGWLCALFGHITRIKRVFNETIKAHRGQAENAEQEVGRLLLYYRMSTISGEKVNPWTRDTDFQHIRSLVMAGEVTLQPHPEVYLAHTLMSRMMHEKHYGEAYDFLQDMMKRVAKTHAIAPEVLASFLHEKAHLLGRWSSYVAETDEATRLRQECADVLIEVVEMWRACLKKSLPLQERYFEFKMARALNDLAYYSRLLNHLDDAEKAITECLYLKEEKKATLPGSLGVSLGEYAQLLVARGRYRDADVKNGQAIQHLDQLLQSGDLSVAGDKGLLLFERAYIFRMQGRLDEEKQLLHEALQILSDDRDEFRSQAEQRLARIRVIEASSPRYQLDSRWYAQYHPIAKYDDLRWLDQAGPLTIEEQHVWDQLYPRRNEEEIWQQLAKIIQQSKEREFAQSAAECRLPHILYPAIDINDICSRIQDFSKLKEVIEREEANIVVRRLYTRKIEEHLLNLCLVEATYKQDLDGLRTCNEALYGKISEVEMTIALREFFKLLKRAQKNPQAGEIAEQLLKQLKQWHLFAEDFVPPDEGMGQKNVSKKLQQWRKTPVSSQAVQRLYEQALETYGFTEWRVILSPERDGMALDLDLCELYLPTNDRFTVLTCAELLAEEIETHILRSASGKRSKLTLLSSGTQRFLPTDEGLAIIATQEMMEAHGLGQKSYSWVTTLAPGMAMGILTPPHSFRSLYDFFSKVFLANHLQSGRYETIREAEEAARYDTFVRVSRTFRGIPDVDAVGVTNLKDRVYLQGFREVSEALAKAPRERLFVGSIGTHDLADMEELHILQPAVEYRHLAKDPQLFEKTIALEK